MIRILEDGILFLNRFYFRRYWQSSLLPYSITVIKHRGCMITLDVRNNINNHWLQVLEKIFFLRLRKILPIGIFKLVP